MSYPIILHSIHEDANIQQKHGGMKRRRETRPDLPAYCRIPRRRRQETKEAKSMKSRLEPEAPQNFGWWSQHGTQHNQRLGGGRLLFFIKIESERKWEYLSIIGSELPKRGLPTNSPSKIWSNKVSKLPKTHNFLYPFSHNHQGLGDTPIFQPWFLQGRASPPTIKKSALPKSDTKVLNLLPKVSP